MPRPIHAQIHTSALCHNLQEVQRRANGARVWAVVKANAYGHGIARAWQALAGADGFALLDLNEGVLLRELGWRGPILLLEGVFEPSDLALCARYDLWHAVHCNAQLDWLQDWRGDYRHQVFLKLNGGMNRLGFVPGAFSAARARLAAMSGVGKISLMMHFSDADAPRLGQDGIAHQVQAFRVASEGMAEEVSVCNSAAILRYGAAPGLRSDWVRAGIVLYGGSPDYPEHDIGHWNTRPAMTLSSRLLAVQTLAAGDTVGYGSTFTAQGPMRVGVVACGYADGYPRHAPTGTPVLVDGIATRVVGRVSMDMLTVDLTPVPDAGFGSEVTLWGHASAEHGGAVLPIDDVAHACGTIGYELMCAVAPRVPVSVDDEIGGRHG